MYVKHIYNEVLGTSKFTLLKTFFFTSLKSNTRKLNENFVITITNLFI